MAADRVGRISASKILAAGERSDIGLKLEPSSAGLPGLSRGIILPVFHMDGMVVVFRHRL